MLNTTDRDLVLQARRGDLDAFGELVRRYQTAVFNVCYRLAGERREAEDLTQEAFIRACQRLGTFDVDLPFGPWMRRVAANVALNRLERAGPQVIPLDDERDDLPAGPGGDPVAARECAEREESLRSALAALPPRYRAVIELRHFQDLSYAEIAQMLRIPVSDVKSYLFRARKALARALGVGGMGIRE